MAKYRLLKPSRFENAGPIYETGSIIDESLLGKMKPGENLELIADDEPEEEIVAGDEPVETAVKPVVKPVVKPAVK